MKVKNRENGFAMIETLIIVMIFLVIASSLFASAGAIQKRTAKSAAKNEAYYASLTAVKLIAGGLVNDVDGKAAEKLMGTDGRGLSKEEGKTEITITMDSGEIRTIPVDVSVHVSQDKTRITINAEAEVGGQKEHVSMTLRAGSDADDILRMAEGANDFVQTPSSAADVKRWSPLRYDRNPASEE